MERWRSIGAAPADDARALLRVCCGSGAWVERMLARRPFADARVASRAAREEWFGLSPADWLEAFSHHPRIGDRDAMRTRFASTRHLTEGEQAAVSWAPEDVLAALLEANRAYEARFGYIFIVCASGKSADEMLSILHARLINDPDEELRVAAEEHAQICELRLLADV